MINLESEEKACLKALKTLDYDEGIVIGSYIGKLKQQNQQYREAIKTAMHELEGGYSPEYINAKLDKSLQNK